MKRRVLLWGIVTCGLVVALLVWLLAGNTTEPAAARSVEPTRMTPAQVAPMTSGDGTDSLATDGLELEGLRLEGLVVDGAGEPVRGAQVWLDEPVRATVTGDDGTFALGGLRPGRYRVAARRGDAWAGPQSHRLGERSEPVVLRLVPGVAVEVTVVDEVSAPVTGAEVRGPGEPFWARTDETGSVILHGLAPGRVELEARAPGFAPGRLRTSVQVIGTRARVTMTLRKGFPVAGHVRDEHGRGVGGARVYAMRDGRLFDASAPSVVTEDDGRFAFPAVAPGVYWLAVSDDEHQPEQTARMLIDQAMTGIEVVMHPGARVAGRVVDPRGRPVANAVVRVADVNDRRLLHPPRHALTNADGTYELRGLVRTRYTLRAEADEGTSAPRDVDLEADGPALGGQDFVLDAPLSIAGVVVDEREEPVPGVSVRAMEQYVEWPAALSTAITDDRGAFSLDGLAPGLYSVEVVSGNDLHPSESAEAGARDVRIVYPRAGVIEGAIVLAGSGAPPAAFYLALEAEGERVLQTAGGADGRFTLREIPAGEYVLALWGPELAETRTRSFEVLPGETTNLGTLRVGHGLTVTGKVVDDEGHPVAGAQVTVGYAPLLDRSSDDVVLEGIRSAVSDASGAFSIVGLHVERKVLAIAAVHPERGVSVPFDLPAGAADPPPVTLVLRETGSLAGRITQNGEPLVRVLVGAGEPSIKATYTDARGEFLLSALPAGPRVLWVFPDGVNAQVHDVHVAAGTQTRVSIDVPASEHALLVEVHREEGAAFPHAALHLLHGEVSVTNRREVSSRSFTRGRGYSVWSAPSSEPVRFDRLSPGPHTLCAVPLDEDPMSYLGNINRIDARSESHAVHCTPVTVAPAPAEQRITLDIPSMTVRASP